MASSSGRGARKRLGEEDRVLGRDPVDGLGEGGRVGHDLADLLAQDLGVEQLLAVVPLVERLGLVLALVALQPQQPAPGGLGEAECELGLADAGGTLEQDRLVEPGLEEDGGGQPVVDEVAVLGEAGLGPDDVGEVGLVVRMVTVGEGQRLSRVGAVSGRCGGRSGAIARI